MIDSSKEVYNAYHYIREVTYLWRRVASDINNLGIIPLPEEEVKKDELDIFSWDYETECIYLDGEGVSLLYNTNLLPVEIKTFRDNSFELKAGYIEDVIREDMSGEEMIQFADILSNDFRILIEIFSDADGLKKNATNIRAFV